jgi:hypothetical protein
MGWRELEIRNLAAPMRLGRLAPGTEARRHLYLGKQSREISAGYRIIM